MENQRRSDESAPEDNKLTRKYDLVEQMKYLFVRVVRARGFPNAHDLCVEVKLGNLEATTRFSEGKFVSPEWNQVFAFEEEKIHTYDVVVVVKDNTDMSDAYIGRVKFIVVEVPKRVPPESSLAPQWYKLEDQTGTQLARGDIMLSLWKGTQADEYFPKAWCSDATDASGDAFLYTRSKGVQDPYPLVSQGQCDSSTRLVAKT